MWLVASPSFEFAKFIQILSWILLPVLAGTVLLTYLFHYRKSKKNYITAEDAENNFVLAFPEQFIHKKNDDGEYILFDHSGLILEYKKRMFYNHARYIALQKEYALLETKYSSLISSNSITTELDFKKTYMENLHEQASPHLAALQGGDISAEQKEMSDKFELLNRSYRRLEEENRFLQEQISLQTAKDDDEKEKIINRWKEENRFLRNKVTDQEYVQELLNERNAQIIFLQNQLEQRIRNQHQADQQRQQAIAELEQAREQYKHDTDQMESLKHKLQAIIAEKEELMSSNEQELASKTDMIIYLESILNETKTQNELLNAQASDTKDIAIMLQVEVETKQERIKYLEQKLDKNLRVINHLFKEISACVNSDESGSPVIELNPVYLDKETTAVRSV